MYTLVIEHDNSRQTVIVLAVIQRNLLWFNIYYGVIYQRLLL